MQLIELPPYPLFRLFTKIFPALRAKIGQTNRKTFRSYHFQSRIFDWPAKEEVKGVVRIRTVEVKNIPQSVFYVLLCEALGLCHLAQCIEHSLPYNLNAAP